ncbi:hypothetical protein [Ruminococcus sp.]|uniref:hypothetical protein n=1 Tax=Ruminococcus sp. TaxID=41978 RepID=UPI0025D9F7B8|nr:hypothetical protein [Ruminococcus sp.]MBQ9542789.1 hypothetical protein [Ruminococcus sp.]
MTIIKYPSENEVNTAIAEKEPMLMLISFDGRTAIISQIDEAVEHHILLAKAGFPSTDIDKYFRIVLDEDGADWTFVCPPDYKGISDKQRRITAFYKDGFAVISDTLAQLGFMVGINIPKRYRRHFDYMMSE